MEASLPNDTVELRYYARDGSVFLDSHYLIKGVAGALLCKLVREHQRYGRSEFSLRELRLAGAELRLPEVQDNLGGRMLLLQRRLADRAAPLQIVKVGRGRFRLDLQRPLRLVDMAPAPHLPAPPMHAPHRPPSHLPAPPTWRAEAGAMPVAVA